MSEAGRLHRNTPRAARDWRGVRVCTVGHSTRSIDELAALLHAVGVTVLADVRTIPRSRHNPQFDGEALSRALRHRHIRYVHVPALGGLRHARRDSVNTGFRNASFRGFADYMQTEGFEAGLAELRRLAENPVAIMCAEAVPWRCHRSLVADALTVRGAEVEHITSLGRTSPHRLTPFARVEGTRVTYPGDEAKALTLQARQSHAGSEEKAPQLGAPVAHSGSKAKSLRRDALAVGSGSNVKGRRPDARPAHSGSKAKSLLLETRAPFHLEATVRVLQRRPTNPVDRWVSDRYQRVLTTPHGLALVEVANEGTIDAPDVRLRVLASEHSTDASPISTVRRLLGLDVDPRPLQRLVEAESRLRSLGMALRGMRPPRFAGLFEAVANVVPFQQVSLDAGVAIVSRLVERFGATLEHDGTRHRAFPTAETIAGARLAALKACGMSQRKAETLERVARSIASGDLTEEALALMKSPDALRFLTELPGIGPWSASLILLRGLGRLDVFPPGDVGVTRGLSTLLRLPPGPSLTRIIDRFGDLRGYLYFYSLGGALLEKEWIRAAPSLQRPRRNVDRK